LLGQLKSEIILFWDIGVVEHPFFIELSNAFCVNSLRWKESSLFRLKGFFFKSYFVAFSYILATYLVILIFSPLALKSL